MYKLYITNNNDTKTLLSTILKEEYNLTNYEIYFNEYNKPYLKDINIYFNISHDKDKTVLVISDKEIGVDIEYYTYKSSVVNKYFNEKEQKIVNEASNKELEFTKIWVMKESFVKMKGIGLSFGLKNVDTTLLKDQIDIKQEKEYIIAICRSEE